MGVDCSLFTEKRKYILDRWYCFSNTIENKKIYNKKDFIDKIYECIDYHINDFIDSSKDEQIQNKEYLSYCIGWCHNAIINAGEKNVIIQDTDDLYFNHKELFKKISDFKV